MRAIVVKRHGPPEVLRCLEVPQPEVAANQVLIRVKSIGVNSADLLARMGLQPEAPKPPFIPGLEVAGTIEQLPPAPVGRGRRLAKDLEPLRLGDPVIALTTFGGYAEKLCVSERQVFRLPDGILLDDAAAIPLNYLTGYHVIFEMGNLREGNRILIQRAASGVGIAAVQLAKAHNLVVFGTAGTGEQEFLLQMGVDYPIDYTRQDFVEVLRSFAPGGIEMVMDPTGGSSFSRSYRCLAPTGRLVVYGFPDFEGLGSKRSLWRSIGGSVKRVLERRRIDPLTLIRDNTSVLGVDVLNLLTVNSLLRKELAEVFRMCPTGLVRPVIDRRFPLAEAAEAHRYVQDHRGIGKVLLTVD